jgi:hypothetical protein
MFTDRNTTTKVVNTAKKSLKRYSYKERLIALPFDDFGSNVQAGLEAKGYQLIADNGSVKTYTGLPGYAYVVLIEQPATDYLICCETEHAYVQWMRKYSMVTHLIEKFLPTT